MKRRTFLWVMGMALPAAAQAPVLQDIRPLIERVTKGANPGRENLDVDLPQIAENGNSVPLRVLVASPMTAGDHVKAIYVFAPRNPRPQVAAFHIGPYSGRAEISARIRLAGTQPVTVLVELSENRFLVRTVDVLVTLAACLDEASL